MSTNLQIAVIGGGIAGLSAAIGLSDAGHDVVIFEKSRFKNELGAAIAISPNATRVLDGWGFNFDTAGAVDNRQMRRMNAETLEIESQENFEDVEKTYGGRWAFFHRADLHNGLRNLVRNHSRSTISIELGCEVISIDCEQGSFVLQDGRTIHKDLLIVADGAHCPHIPSIIGEDAPNVNTPMSMYRFLIPFEKIMNDERTRSFYENQLSGFLTFYKTQAGRPGLLLNTYPCRNGEFLYCGLLHPTKPDERDVKDWNNPATVDDVLACAQVFHPAIQAICEKAVDVRVYTQMFRNSIPSFVRGKTVLIGDAAHFMLPTHGQGASSSIEDAMALGILLTDATVGNFEKRLQLFQQLRHPRATATQALSNYLMAPGPKMIAEARKYYVGPLPPPGSKTHSQPFCDFFFKYDICKESAKVIDEAKDPKN